MQYLEPRGSKDCKIGWSIEEVGDKLAQKKIVEEGWVGPGKDLLEAEDQRGDVSVVTFEEHRAQLNKGFTVPSTKLPEVDLVGKE